MNVIYLDNAATSFPKPETVWNAVEHALREIGVGPGRGGHSRGLAATRLVFEAREEIAQLLGVADSSRIAFTHSATEALNLAIQGSLKPGDHAITTTMEHNSLVRPLRLMEERGVAVTKVPCDSTGLVDPAAIVAALRPETRLVALSHCSNVTGTIQPVEEIGRLLKGRGIRYLIDAAQSAGSIPLDLAAAGVDLLAAPGHKGLLGPQGTGFLYIAEGAEPEPLLVGGTGGYSDHPGQPEAMPERYESGTLNTPGIAGLKAGVEFIRRTGIAAIREKEETLTALLMDGLGGISGVTLHGPPASESRGAVVSFTLEGKDPSEIGFILDTRYGISVRVGLHCAPDAHRTIGTHPGGTVRVSPGFFTTEEEIGRFVDAMRTIAA